VLYFAYNELKTMCKKNSPGWTEKSNKTFRQNDLSLDIDSNLSIPKTTSEHQEFLQDIPNIRTYSLLSGTAVAQWLRCSATNRKVVGSIPAGVGEYFIDIKSIRSHYGSGVDSASNRNEYQEYFLGVNPAGA